MGNDTMRNRQDSSAEDPLAELARLMGQEDEFADLLKKAQASAPPAGAPARPRPAAPAPGAGSAGAAPRAPMPPRPAAPAP
ncbi:SPOR domain-containing protein, partial [Ancylobacter sp. GSK1Z-4-2]|nr:SPOR domain-containing protein [Ancylobacter mangrovi]